MQDIEEHHVARKARDRFADVMKTEVHVAIAVRGDLGAVTNLARVEVEPDDWLAAGALAQIKSQQSYAAADIENRLGRVSHQLVSGLVNPVAPQLAPDVTAEPWFRELRRHARTRAFVFRRVFYLGYHLRRIIALAH